MARGHRLAGNAFAQTMRECRGQAATGKPLAFADEIVRGGKRARTAACERQRPFEQVVSKRFGIVAQHAAGDHPSQRVASGQERRQRKNEALLLVIERGPGWPAGNVAKGGG